MLWARRRFVIGSRLRRRAPCFSGVGPSLYDLGRFQVICLFGITLAILPVKVRADLIRRLSALREPGHQIVVDSKYRPRLWPDEATEKAAFAAL